MKNLSHVACFILIPLFFSFSAQAQIISTIAGKGTPGFAGDGGAATAAEINAPNGVFADKKGNLYFADYLNQRIRRVDTLGNITTVAGNGVPGFSGDGGPATTASLNHASGLAVNKSGEVVFCDANNNRVRAINGGIITTIAGNGAPVSGGDGGLATAATFNRPSGVYFDTSGNLFIAEQCRVRVIKASTGMITTCAGTIPGFGGDGGPATNAQFNDINFITVDEQNNLYISDNSNQRIRKVNSLGIVSTIAGIGYVGFSGDGGPATNAELSYPSGAIADVAGNVYISDALNYRIRKIDKFGIINTYAGTGAALYGGDGGPATAADIDFPQVVSLDPQGNLIFGDYNNNRIRKITQVYYPHFSSSTHTLNTCKDSAGVSIGALLAVDDTDIGGTETWTILHMPVHGTLNGFSDSSVAMGDTITPAGLAYSAATGYLGADSFFVKVSNGAHSDSIKINVIIHDCSLGSSLVNNGGQFITVAPNPNNGAFNLFVSSANSQVADVIITNMLGQKVNHQSISTNSKIEILLNEPVGIYFISAYTSDGLQTSKFMIEK
jgi:hypothetical protein